MSRSAWPVLRLRSHLAALLVAAMLLTFVLVLGGLLAYQVPRIEARSHAAQQREVAEMRARMELLLQAQRRRLALLEALIDAAPPQAADAVLDQGVGDGSVLRAIYRLSPQGRVVAAGLAPALRHQREDLLGSDLSANPLFRAVAGRPALVWRGTHVSVLDGQSTVGVGWSDRHGDVLLAEVQLRALVAAVRVAAGTRSASIWVVDRGGEIIADSRQGQDVGTLNIRNWPLMRGMLREQPPVERFEYGGTPFHATVSHSAALDWYFVGRMPVGWAHPQVRALVLSVVAVLLGSLVIALLVAPFWATRMARPLDRIIERVDRSGSGHDGDDPWPRSSVAEFNRLACELESLTGALRARERKSQAIFHASPVPMAVSDTRDDDRLLDVNRAWCKELRYRREDVLQRLPRDLGLLADPQLGASLRRHVERNEPVGDLCLRRSDGSTVQVSLHARLAQLPSARLMVWATMDVGPMRLVERELRELNQQLESRVQQRTEALASANAALSTTVEQLRAAQDDLVQAEKMAALGGLVAGVAHELNTPLGNGVMAVSAMGDAVRGFQEAMRAGVRRSALDQLLESIGQGVDIAGRNLRRAAELVHSFKQVAVDQTSAQRRRFEVGEVVHEMVVSLRPSFHRTPYRIEVDVPASGLVLDSYPGALGQTIGNLIQNAVLHGFDGRAHGTVRISAGREDDGWVWLHVQDDGRGIAPEHIDRIFEPFMTTRMGRGGTGLGLHISYNAVVNVLGGTLSVHSVVGAGASFVLRLPPDAPRTGTHGRPADAGADPGAPQP